MALQDIVDLAEKNPRYKKIIYRYSHVNRLRDTYPFIADVDCPQELKVIFSDYISTYQRISKNRTSLLFLTDHTVVAGAIISDSTLNAICKKELDTYKRTGLSLQVHPIWMENEELKRYSEMSAIELSEERKRLSHNIQRLLKQIADKKEERLKEDRQTRAIGHERRLMIVDTILNSLK